MKFSGSKNGTTLVELVIALMVITIAAVAASSTVVMILGHGVEIDRLAAIKSRCMNVMQEMSLRSTDNLKAMTTVPDFPAMSNPIATFTIQNIDGQGEVRLSSMLKDVAKGYEVLRMEVRFVNSGVVDYEITTYKAKYR